MMEHTDIQRINSNQVMSAVTIHNQTVYVSGQVPDSTRQDISGQTQEVLTKIDQLLKLAGTDKSPAAISIKVDLPQPEGPIKAVNRPASTAREKFSNKDFFSP